MKITLRAHITYDNKHTESTSEEMQFSTGPNECMGGHKVISQYKYCKRNFCMGKIL